MSGTEDRSALAAEFALGVLEGPELADARRLMDTDPDFAAMVEEWNGRLAPLSRFVPETAPPADLWARIEASVAAIQGTPGLTEPRAAGPNGPGIAESPPGAATPAANDNVASRRRVRFWQATTGLSLAVAASLALFLVVRPPVPQPSVAVLAPMQGAQAVLVATLDASGALTIRPNGTIAVPTGRDLELWSLPKGATRPTSLGVLPAGGRQLTARLAADTQLLVSLEPAGGSPTGLPTGPVLYGGTLTVVN